MATDKLHMQQSILNGHSFFILNHVNSQNKTILQLTLDLLSFRHIELKSSISRYFKSRQISCQNTTLYCGKTHRYFPCCFGRNQKPAYPRHYWDTLKVKSHYFSPNIPGPQGDVTLNDWCIKSLVCTKYDVGIP